jgi:hypothetical protein
MEGAAAARASANSNRRLVVFGIGTWRFGRPSAAGPAAERPFVRPHPFRRLDRATRDCDALSMNYDVAHSGECGLATCPARTLMPAVGRSHLYRSSIRLLWRV